MEIFETIKINLAMCHLFSDQTKVFDMQRVLTSIISILFVVLHFIFLLCEAHTIEEYVRSTYMTTTALGLYIAFTTTLFKTPKLFTMIEHVERIVEMSKLF